MSTAHHGTSQDLTRRTLLVTATAVPPAAATGAPALAAAPSATASSTDAQVPALWREFTHTPYTHPQIPYVGRAGARRGARRLPRRPVVADVRDHGAVADGETDSAPAINRAIAAAGRAGGGTVTIPPGTFRIDGLIHIGYDNVVLRGAGSTRTTLYATKNLTELIGVYGSRYGGTKSAWSWAGGLIWLAPKARWDSLVTAIKAQDWPFEGWTGNKRDEWKPLTAVEPARQGSWTIQVADASRLRPGALVLLRVADD